MVAIVGVSRGRTPLFVFVCRGSTSILTNYYNLLQPKIPSKSLKCIYIQKSILQNQQTFACFLPTTSPHLVQKCTLSLQESKHKQLIPTQAKGANNTHHTQAAAPI